MNPELLPGTPTAQVTTTPSTVPGTDPGDVVSLGACPDPASDLFKIETLIPTTERVKEWKEKVDALDWCRRDDDCEVEESLKKALAIAREYDLPGQAIVSKPRGNQPVSLVQHLYFRLKRCSHDLAEGKGTQEEARLRLLNQAIRASGIRMDGTWRNKLDVPDLYYDRQRHCYWHEAKDGTWQSITRETASDFLRAAGLCGQSPPDLSLSEIDRHLANVVHEWGIDAAMPVSGYPCGLHQFNGVKVLVTSSFKLIEPVEGEWPVIRAILTGLLGEKQLPYFLATTKLFYEALRDGRNQPGQMMIFVGPTDSTKSLTQHLILTPVWGGRGADAGRYLTGKTEFNADLFGAEHLILDDAKPYGNWLTRHDFAEGLKSIIVGKVIGCHAKNRQQVNVAPRWRLTMSLNDEGESLKSLPDLTESFQDKVHLFKCARVVLPLPNTTQAERDAFDATIKRELPAFTHHLVTWAIPQAIAGARFGVHHHHHKELLEKLDAMSKESKLANLIDHVIRPEDGKWTGTAEELKSELTRNPSIGHTAERLLNWENATGTLLGKLAKKHPRQYCEKRCRVNGRKVWRWTIKLPDAALE